MHINGVPSIRCACRESWYLHSSKQRWSKMINTSHREKWELGDDCSKSTIIPYGVCLTLFACFFFRGEGVALTRYTTFWLHRAPCYLIRRKIVMARFHTRSRASRRLHIFTLNFDWFSALPLSFVIGQADYFGYRVTTLHWEPFIFTFKLTHVLSVSDSTRPFRFIKTALNLSLKRRAEFPFSRLIFLICITMLSNVNAR